MAALPVLANVAVWPEPTREMKPWAYNWWMASAVDAEGLEYQCAEMQEKGFGGFHVIPIYGANGPDKCYRKLWKTLLSPEWVDAWNLAAKKAHQHNLGIDLTMGCGWCFGGPWIPQELGASSGMKVKRAGPGGAGFMIDPYNPEAMKAPIAAFEPLFGTGGKAARPRAFYHDSWEYYGAEPRDKDADIDEAVLDTFRVWTDWCRENGYLTRNEAHGSTANWLDFYALADIPETEMFGKKDRDILISKFSSSAAHIKYTTLVSAETCTWVDEHFHETPAEIKRFIDRLFLSGVNHIFYHGLCYSPVDATWPGWCFYASCEMNPRNPIWREIGALNAYITRCQSMFQTWECDNDLAIVWDPDIFRTKSGNRFKQMSVHARDWFYGEKIGELAKALYEDGYAFDYISPRQFTAVRKRKAKLPARYVDVVDPESVRTEPNEKVRKMPFALAKNGLMATRWRKGGKTMYFVVNQSETAKEVASTNEFTLMAPLSGMIIKTDKAKILPNHSLFLIGDGFEVREAALAKDADKCGVALRGPWEVTPITGGPVMPPPHTLSVAEGHESLEGWQTWDDAFSGTMLYKTEFDDSAAGAPVETSPECSKNKCRSFDLGEVREIARVRLNGVDLGVRFMKPYIFCIPDGLLKEKGNTLEVEVTNLGANRIRWNDRNGVEWKYFTDANMKAIDYKDLDASAWPVLKSGLLGPVRLK